jgi:hypothetical protein
MRVAETGRLGDAQLFDWMAQWNWCGGPGAFLLKQDERAGM